MKTNDLKKVTIKEFKIARAIALICMIAVHTEFAIYNYNNETFATFFDYIGSPYVAPILMFILGSNIILSSNSSPKKLFVRGVKLFAISIVFNIICHALPFFIIDYKLGGTSTVENPLHWIFAVDILTFAGLAFIFFAIVRKLKLSNLTISILAILASVLNFYLIKNFQIDFENNTFLAAITSLFYGSSITGYFSFLGWIIFPVVGYIFIQLLLKTEEKNKNKFYANVGIFGVLIYLIMVYMSFKYFQEFPLVVFKEEYSYYWMPPYCTIATIAFCLAWISIMYFISKIIPKFLNRHIDRLNKNLTTIYIIQWFIINYIFVVPFLGNLKVNEWQFVLIVILIIILSDLLATAYKKYLEWKKKV